MEEFNQEDFDEFMNRYLDNLHKAYKISAYNEIISYNKNLIDNVKMIISGHIIAILHNPNYISLLSKFHKLSVTLINGKIDISDFIILLSNNDEDRIARSIVTFNIDIINKGTSIITSRVIITYDDDEEISLIYFKSDLLDDKFRIKFNYDLKDLIEKDKEYREAGMYKNKLLVDLIDILYDILDVEEAESLATRQVYCFMKGDNDDQEEGYI